MKIPNIPSELFYIFNNVKYYDEPHKYYLNNKELTSVTTLIHKYVNEFDEEYWSDIKANEYGVTQDLVKYAWYFLNKTATMKGSAIHDYAENLFLNKIFPYPKDTIIDEFGYDSVLIEYNQTKKHVDDFYELVKNVLIPVKTELVVYDEEFMIGGMIDLLFYNLKSKQIEIWDHKTNKNFSIESNYFLNDPLYLVSNSDLDKYSLQLSAYKYIIEKNTSIKLGQSHIIWYSSNEPKYQVFKCYDYEDHVKTMFDDHKK